MKQKESKLNKLENFEVRPVVGDFFEEKVKRLFDLIRIDSTAFGIVPDLISPDYSFYVEVKASAYSNGGVIKRGQLYRFEEGINIRRFYAFAYHSISKDMRIDYPTERELREALSLRSLFLFPFSVVKAYFEMSKKRKHPKCEDFVQLREFFAVAVFNGEQDAWSFLNLRKGDYRMTRPHEKIHIMTRRGYLEQQILDSFHPEFV